MLWLFKRCHSNCIHCIFYLSNSQLQTNNKEKLIGKQNGKEITVSTNVLEIFAVVNQSESGYKLLHFYHLSFLKTCIRK